MMIFSHKQGLQKQTLDSGKQKLNSFLRLPFYDNTQFTTKNCFCPDGIETWLRLSKF